MQLGKMYLVKEFFWFLFPTKELAGDGEGDLDHGVEGPEVRWAGVAQSYAKLLSENYNCNVSFFEPKTYVVLLEESKNCYKLLDCNGNVGWIRCWDFSDYFKLVKANQ